MNRTGSDRPDISRSTVEQRLEEAPHLVVEHLRLVSLLEAEDDLTGAAAALQKAHFFLPNSPIILREMGRLSDYLESSPPNVEIRPRSLPAEAPTDDSDAYGEDRLDDEASGLRETESAANDRDELDELIEGLSKGRRDLGNDVVTPPEREWTEDDDLLATETLAQIYVAQNQLEEALLVYDRLIERETDPQRTAVLRDKAAAIRSRL